LIRPVHIVQDQQHRPAGRRREQLPGRVVKQRESLRRLPQLAPVGAMSAEGLRRRQRLPPQPERRSTTVIRRPRPRPHHVRAVTRRGHPRQLRRQAGLADPRLTTAQHQSGLPFDCRREPAAQVRQLPAPTDELALDHSFDLTCQAPGTTLVAIARRAADQPESRSERRPLSGQAATPTWSIRSMLWAPPWSRRSPIRGEVPAITSASPPLPVAPHPNGSTRSFPEAQVDGGCGRPVRDRDTGWRRVWRLSPVAARQSKGPV